MARLAELVGQGRGCFELSQPSSRRTQSLRRTGALPVLIAVLAAAVLAALHLRPLAAFASNAVPLRTSTGLAKLSGVSHYIGSSAAAPLDRHANTQVARFVGAGVAPAADSLKQPPIKRLVGDVFSAVGAPLRFYQMARITREVAEGAKQRFKQNSKKDSKSSGSGATKTLQAFLPTYMKSHVIARTKPEDYRNLLNVSLNLLIDSIQAEKPFAFKPHHMAIRDPERDLYAWGNNFFRSMVKFRKSRVVGLDQVAEISAILKRGDNVVLLANHQTEADPQVLSLLMEREGYPELGELCTFVAGHKVTTDPLAVPFSMGRNLLTIFSKKYLDQFGEKEREEKNAWNRETVVQMQRMLTTGGNLFWVAPSGGRDRRSPESGRFEPAAFDPASVGLFQLLAQKAGRNGTKTHFFPLAMWSHELVPPPEDTVASVGEVRSAARAAIALEFGAEMDPEALGGRKKFPAAAERLVRQHYAHLDQLMKR
mmetsp:Transcript_21368/g.47304  ORF Transcript_21368/g.47304 Transcript_21368/m.47304 type:complete len:482 (-) Transcript_21368:98-1543(-)